MINPLEIISLIQKQMDIDRSIDYAFMSAVASISSIYLSENLTLMIEAAEILNKISAKNLNLVEGEIIEDEIDTGTDSYVI